jgi:hypothetical protein
VSVPLGVTTTTRAIAGAFLSVCLTGCLGSSPAAPAPFGPPLGDVGISGSRLMPLCDPEGADVVCRAFVLTGTSGSHREVTASARWAAVPSDVATVVAPGRFRPIGSGELTIDVRVDGTESPELETKFLVDPNRNARSMPNLSITVQEGPVARVDGATVKMLDGYRAGTECTTFLGSCLVSFVPAGETYTLRISKSGYQVLTVRHEVVETTVPASYLTVILSRE